MKEEVKDELNVKLIEDFKKEKKVEDNN